ncbi:calcium-binding protein [Bosea sp. 2KB_26]|uniref:calcium-binding protein n=1 Tax=Bosea sp. 2KB_26 TaxID=3237475 RepID=UPI003F8F135D
MANIDGTTGDDTLFGTEDADLIRGLAGADFILGFGGNDTLEGGDGDDQLAGGGGADALQGGAGNDTLAGDSNFEIAGVDTLTGGAGNDRFEWDPFGGTSTAALTDIVTDFQGAGNAIGDTLEFDAFSPATRFSFGGQLAAMPSLGSAIGTSGDGLAAVSYAFNGGNTFVLADTNDNGSYDVGDLTIRLNGQLNLVQSDFGSTRFVIAGTNGADTLNGTQGNDTILGLGGNDTINGRAGDDVIEGGNGADTLNGGDGIDRIQGGNGADTINGGEGRDFLTGDAGNDTIDGGAGDDGVLAGGDGNDTVSGGAGDDNVDGDDGADTLSGGIGDDDMFGGNGSDAMFGDAGADELFGGRGNDQLSGGAGADELEGEEGADRIEGGAGNDQFNFNAGAFQPDSSFSVRDFVADFQRAGLADGDVLQLSGSEFAWVGAINANPRIGAALPGGGDELTQLGYIQRAGNTFLVADTNDDGVLDADDFTVEFAGLQNFTTGDFTSTDFVIAGTNGDDVITGTPEDDRIFAAGGNDQVTGLGGSDEIHGGAGDDILDGGPGGFDNLFGEAGNDRLTLATSDGGGVASGGEGDDVLFGSDSSFSNFDNSLQGDAGNDELHAGAVGSGMNGGAGSDRLISGAADDQMEAGRDEFGFDLDNAQDLFVYSGTGRWSTEGSFFGDTVSGFQDGSDLFDLRGSGLQFSDLSIVNEDFQTTITSERGQITLFESFGQEVFLDQDDFLFGPAPAPFSTDPLFI